MSSQLPGKIIVALQITPIIEQTAPDSRPPLSVKRGERMAVFTGEATLQEGTQS